MDERCCGQDARAPARGLPKSAEIHRWVWRKNKSGVSRWSSVAAGRMPARRLLCDHSQTGLGQHGLVHKERDPFLCGRVVFMRSATQLKGTIEALDQPRLSKVSHHFAFVKDTWKHMFNIHRARLPELLGQRLSKLRRGARDVSSQHVI